MIEALCLSLAFYDADSGKACGVPFRLVAASGPIDAPEIRCQSGRWCDRALAIEARDYVRSVADKYRLTTDCKGQDRYRRALCRVTVNGRDLGDDLVRRGYAVVREDWR